MYEFSISLTGEKIDARTFLEAIGSALKLLRSLDKAHTIRWRLATLRYSSPATVGFVGEAKKREQPYGPEDVGRSLLAGVASLEEGSRPKAFTDEALELAKRIADLRGRGGIRGVVFTSQNGTVPEVLPVTRRTAATVDDMIGVKYESQGSVEGRLEVVSSHGGILRCNVYERVFGKPVRCDVPDRLRKRVLELFDQTVAAIGRISRDSSGQPRHIALESIEPVQAPPAVPQSLAGIAPDFTEGADSVDYIKKRW